MSLAIVDAELDGERVGLRCTGGAIAAVGAEVAPQPGDEVLDAGGDILVPGLVNGHTHAAMTLFRGQGGDLPLMRWLEERIWPVESRLEAEDVYWGTRLACVEMIRSGTVRLWDMYWHPEAAARAVTDAGLRATAAAPLIDSSGDVSSLRAAALESLEAITTGDMVEAGLAPHAIYTVSAASLEWVAGLAAERRLSVQIHLSETEREVEDCLATHGRRPAGYLDSLGLLGPRTILAHGVWLDRSELELIAEREATIVTNPVANMKLGVGGIFPFPAAREARAAIGLGTDGAGSNDSLDLFADVKAFALAQKHAAADPGAVTAEEAWGLATGAHSPLLTARGAADPPALAAGAPADLLLLRADAPELQLGGLAEALVYAASGAVVETTIVAGEVLMRGGEVMGRDGVGPDEVLAKALERARRLGLA